MLEGLAGMNADSALVTLRQDDYDELQRKAAAFDIAADLPDQWRSDAQRYDDDSGLLNCVSDLEDALAGLKYQPSSGEASAPSGGFTVDDVPFKQLYKAFAGQVEGLFPNLPQPPAPVTPAAAEDGEATDLREETWWAALVEISSAPADESRDYGERVPVQVLVDSRGLPVQVGEVRMTAPKDGIWGVALFRNAEDPALFTWTNRTHVREGDRIQLREGGCNLPESEDQR